MLIYEDIVKIHVELSSACNASCPVCPRNICGGTTTPGLKISTMSVDDFKHIFPTDFIAQLDQILFCGRYGDPALCTDLPKILDYIAEHNESVDVVMHTNGGVRPPAWWKQLASFGPNLRVIFSIDGLDDTNHIYRRGVKWDKLWNNVTSFIDNDGRAFWEYLVFQHNEHQIEIANQLAIDTGFEYFQLKRPYGFDLLQGPQAKLSIFDKEGQFEYDIHPSNNYANQVWHKTTETSAEPITIIQPVAKQYPQKFAKPTRNTTPVVLPESNIDCHAIKQREIYVDAQGLVHPCCWLAYAGQADISPDSASEERYVAWLAEHVGTRNISAHNSSLKDIVESSYFKLITETWLDDPFVTCTQMCTKAKNLRTNLLV